MLLHGMVKNSDRLLTIVLTPKQNCRKQSHENDYLNFAREKQKTFIKDVLFSTFTMCYKCLVFFIAQVSLFVLKCLGKCENCSDAH